MGAGLAALAVVAMVGCRESSATTESGASSGGPRDVPAAKEKGGLEVSSAALQSGQPVAQPYACADYEHLGKSPPLSWSKGPPGTVGYAITVTDPDAKDFVHWAVLDVPAEVTSLPEGASPGGALPPGARELKNGYDQVGYGGPCPPKGAKVHHYVFRVWALGSPVNAAAADPGLFEALQKAALATGSVTVDYQR